MTNKHAPTDRDRISGLPFPIDRSMMDLGDDLYGGDDKSSNFIRSSHRKAGVDPGRRLPRRIDFGSTKNRSVHILVWLSHRTFELSCRHQREHDQR